MMRYVFRVELPHGAGPYNTAHYPPEVKKEAIDRLHYKISNHSADKNRWPSPYNDYILGLNHEDYCGFDSLKQLRAWFYLHLAALQRTKHRITVYQVDSMFIRFGSKQLVFVKDKAVPVCFTPPLEWKKLAQYDRLSP